MSLHFLGESLQVQFALRQVIIEAVKDLLARSDAVKGYDLRLLWFLICNQVVRDDLVEELEEFATCASLINQDKQAFGQMHVIFQLFTISNLWGKVKHDCPCLLKRERVWLALSLPGHRFLLGPA